MSGSVEAKKMRILQVTPYFGEHYGGTERYCFNLSKALVEMGHDVQVFASRIKPATKCKEEIAGIKIHRFPTPTTIWNINPFSPMIHRLLTGNYDVVHVHSYLYFSANQALLAKIIRTAFRRKMSIVLHLHGGLGIPPYLKHQPIKKVAKHVYDATIGRIMMQGADYILSACQSDASLARRHFRIPEHKISVVYNGINTELFDEKLDQDHKPTNPYLLYVGDLERWKGPRTLIHALSILNEKGHDMSLKLAGAGSLENQLRKMADGLDIDFLGSVPHSQIPGLMREAFACVLPSYWEGIPTVGIEAMASKTPFIGTAVGGIPEIIFPDETGLLVSPNSPEEIANAVIRLYNNSFRQEIIKNAIDLVSRRFAIKTIAKETEKVYERVLESGHT